MLVFAILLLPKGFGFAAGGAVIIQRIVRLALPAVSLLSIMLPLVSIAIPQDINEEITRCLSRLDEKNASAGSFEKRTRVITSRSHTHK